MRLRIFKDDDTYWLGEKLKQIKSASELKNNQEYILTKDDEYVAPYTFLESDDAAGFLATILCAANRYAVFNMCEKRGLQIFDQVGKKNKIVNLKE